MIKNDKNNLKSSNINGKYLEKYNGGSTIETNIDN